MKESTDWEAKFLLYATQFRQGYDPIPMSIEEMQSSFDPVERSKSDPKFLQTEYRSFYVLLPSTKIDRRCLCHQLFQFAGSLHALASLSLWVTKRAIGFFVFASSPHYSASFYFLMRRQPSCFRITMLRSANLVIISSTFCSDISMLNRSFRLYMISADDEESLSFSIFVVMLHKSSC